MNIRKAINILAAIVSGHMALTFVVLGLDIYSSGVEPFPAVLGLSFSAFLGLCSLAMSAVAVMFVIEADI